MSTDTSKNPKGLPDGIISETDSDIIHILAHNGKVYHAIKKTVQTTLLSAPKYPGFDLDGVETRKIKSNEFEGYFTGRLYTYTYFKLLNVYVPYVPTALD